MIDEYIKYAEGMNANQEVLAWVNQTLAAALRKKRLKYNQGQIEHILDYLCSSAAPKRLLKMSIDQAHSNAEKWVKANIKKGRNLVDTDKDIEVIHEYADGSKIVKLLTANAYKREGTLMSHCLGGYAPKEDIVIYSYRDNKNHPHATFEVQKQNGQISQIKGKGNGAIHPKYIHPILDFLTSIGQKPRPSEMKNLGYYHVDKSLLPLIESIDEFKNQLTSLHGETYAY